MLLIKFKPSVVFSKLTISLLVFLFIFTSQPGLVLAAEEAVSADSSSSAEVSVPADTTATETAAPTTESPVTAETTAQTAETETQALDQAKSDAEAENPHPQTLLDEEESDNSNFVEAKKGNNFNTETDLSSGALIYTLPIIIPPGRNNLQPDLKLVYNSQANENANILGYGWSINIPYIERTAKKGVNNLYSENYFTLSMSGELEPVDLSDSTHGIYGAKVDNGEFYKIEYNSNNYWLVTDKRGTIYKFGYNASARQDDPDDSTHAFKWMLEEVRDTNNNYIKYEYYKNSGQIYPTDIKYTGYNTTDGIFEIAFLRESRSDNLQSFKSGFEVVTNYRINEIQAKVNGTWVRKYELDYTSGDNSLRSTLSSITESGQDGQNNVISLPAISLEYQIHNTDWILNENWEIPLYFNNGYPDLTDPAVKIEDINGDGLVDMIKSSVNGESVYLNDGEGWTYNTSWDIPIAFDISNGQVDARVRIADVNGDGLPDILKSGYNVNEVYLNNGSGWTLNTSWSIPFYFSSGYPDLTDPAVQIADINGDGLVDMFRSTVTGHDVFLNNGSGWTSNSSWDIPISFDIRYGVVDARVKIADVNGDGFPDLLISATNINEVYLNNGSSWVLDSLWEIPLYFNVTYVDLIDPSVQILDINGDGLMDIIKSSEHGENVYLNNGKGWTLSTAWDIPIAFDMSLYGQSDARVRIADVNGDGLPDLLKSGYNVNEVYLNNGPISDLLLNSTNEKGGSFRVTYKPSAQYLDNSVSQNPNLPFVVQTLNYIEYNDGFDNLTSESYFYTGGDYYYNNAFDRKFSGFNKIAKVDGVGNVSMTFFHQGNDTDSSNGEYLDDASKIGKPYRTEIYDDSANLYGFSDYKWENYDLGDSRDFVKQTQKIDFTFDANTSHKDKSETYTYDNANGNLTQKIAWGEVSGNASGTFTDTGSDKFTTDITYASTTGSDVIGLPSQETTVDQSSNKVKETKYYYDSLTLGNVNEGNLTKQEQWKDGSNYINVQKTYNTYGLVTVDTDPRGKTTEYAYDTYNLYPATVTNALDQETDYEYDYSSGKPTQVTDPNSRVFQTVYDALDRPLQEKQPDLTTPSTLVVKTAYAYTDNTVPTIVHQTNNLDSSISSENYIYFDGFGRKIQERKEAEDSNTYSVKDYAYDDMGLLDKESLPYFSTGSAQTTATTDNSLYTSYAYDPLQRVVTATNAVGTTTNTYDDWKLTITDAESNVKDLFKDAYDNLVQVVEHNDTSDYTTNYAYNGLGNLTQIEDSQDNVRNFTYDGLGRRLTAQDLHDPNDTTFGSWTYGYDDAGNLTSRLDPKSQTVNWTYDDLNRVLTENYTGQTGTEVAYVYDTGTDGIGRLYTATTPDVVTTYTYNPLGGTKTENKYIDSTNYLTEFAYDRQGNQTLITYPNDDEVKYIYNTAGLLEQVQNKPSGEYTFADIVSNYDYSPMEQVTLQEDSNGVKTWNDYDEAKLYRLNEKITSSPDEGDLGEGMQLMMLASSSAVIQSEATRNEESIAPATPLSQLDAVGEAVTGFLESLPGGEAIVDSVTATVTPSTTPIEPVKPDEKVQRDFLGRPVNYGNYPKDETKYIKADPNVKPEPLPKEAIEMFDKASEAQDKESKAVTTLPQGMIDFLSTESQPTGDQSLMLLESVNPPNPSTDLKSENLWKSADILYNPGFEDGFDSWQWQNNLDATHQEDCTVSHSGDCSEKVIVSTSGNFWEVQVGQSVKLIAGKTYTWKFWAKASTATEFSLQAYMNHSPWTQQGLFRTVGIDTDWQEYTYTFTPVANDDNSVSTFHLGDNSATYWIDDVSLTPDDLNMTKEPSFEDWGNNWHFVSFGSPYGTGTNTIECANAIDGQCVDMVDVTASYGNYWEVSLDQPVSVTADQTYILTFYARNYSYTPSPARVAIALNHSPWTEISSVVPLEITFNYGALIKYQVELTPSVTESDARLIFYLGESASTFFFDQVKLWPKQATKVSDSTPEFSAIYDDPDSGDTATDYQIQVIKYDGDWNEPVWDSSKTSFTTSVSEGDRTEDISYGGDALALDGMKYKWRIKLWDESDNEGDWTNGNDFFVMAGKRIQDLNYTYDNVGNVTQIVDQSETNTRKNATYAYDDLYQLTSATITDSATDEDYTQTYSYDSLGNFTNRSDVGDYEYEGNTGSSYANPHAMTDTGGVAVSYDYNGNLTSAYAGPYNLYAPTWDYNNRMVASAGTFQWPVEYLYDHAGSRVKMDANTGEEVIVYPNKYYELKTDGEVETVTESIYAQNQLVATLTDDGTTSSLYYVHGDHLGSSSVMTKDDANIEQIVDYYPYGNIRFNQQSDPENESYDIDKKFTSHFYDKHTDLTYMGARYYIGVAGKFISQDPVFLDLGGNGNMTVLLNPQMLNSYSYAVNNPVVNVDKDGRAPGSIALCIAAFSMHQFITNSPNIPNRIREANFSVAHPVAAITIGTAKDGSSSNLSSIASNFAVNMTSYNLGYVNDQTSGGSERNAIRHTVWQGILTNSFGSNTAEQAGNSHEYNPFANLSTRSFSSMGLADQSADLLNNQIGRDIASNNKGLSSQQIAQKSLDYFHDVGLYTVQNIPQGGYNVVQTRISDQQYSNSSQALSHLGNNGLTQ